MVRCKSYWGSCPPFAQRAERGELMPVPTTAKAGGTTHRSEASERGAVDRRFRAGNCQSIFGSRH